jgi:hypothetical protein
LAQCSGFLLPEKNNLYIRKKREKKGTRGEESGDLGAMYRMIERREFEAIVDG